jgi:hypothetical protein
LKLQTQNPTAAKRSNWVAAGLLDKLRARAASRRLSDLTIGPVLTWTTDAILSHTRRLLEIPGAKVLWGGRPLEGPHSIPSCYGAVEPTAVSVPLAALRDAAHFGAATTEVFGPFQVVVEYAGGWGAVGDSVWACRCALFVLAGPQLWGWGSLRFGRAPVWSDPWAATGFIGFRSNMLTTTATTTTTPKDHPSHNRPETSPNTPKRAPPAHPSADGELPQVLDAMERMSHHLTAAVVSNDVPFLQNVLANTVNGTTYAGRRARTTGAPQNHWFGPAGDPRGAGIGTPEAIRLVWSCHREIIQDHGPAPDGAALKTT